MHSKSLVKRCLYTFPESRVAVYALTDITQDFLCFKSHIIKSHKKNMLGKLINLLFDTGCDIRLPHE